MKKSVSALSICLSKASISDADTDVDYADDYAHHNVGGLFFQEVSDATLIDNVVGSEHSTSLPIDIPGAYLRRIGR